MGFRFRRRFRVLPGVHVNVSKSGASVSFGRRGAWFTVGPRGTRTTVGIPGTGLSYTETSHRRPIGHPDPATPEQPATLGVSWGAVLLLALLVWVVWMAVKTA